MNTRVSPGSARLVYRELGERDLDAFHALVVDAHIKRYLLDGEDMTRDWAWAEILASSALFENQGVGIWLVFATAQGEPIGFCGFRVFPELGPEPHLLYALREEHTGKGYATEIARALVDQARDHAGLDRLITAVDEPNRASMRVLDKVGFRACGEGTGAFGRLFYFCLP
jgi:[ribosomal protein S5]-alanine N-acetyltransferase